MNLDEAINNRVENIRERFAPHVRKGEEFEAPGGGDILNKLLEPKETKWLREIPKGLNFSPFPQDLIPLVDTPSGNVIALRMRDDKEPEVVFWDHEEAGNPDQAVTQLAGSVSEFLQNLQSPERITNPDEAVEKWTFGKFAGNCEMNLDEVVQQRLKSLHPVKKAEDGTTERVLSALQHPLLAGALLGGGLGMGAPALMGMSPSRSLWGGYLGSLLGAFGPPLAEEYGPEFRDILESEEA